MPWRKREPDRCQRGLHAHAAFPYAAFRQPDDIDGGKSFPEAYFDLHRQGVNTGEAGRVCRREHTARRRKTRAAKRDSDLECLGAVLGVQVAI